MNQVTAIIQTVEKGMVRSYAETFRLHTIGSASHENDLAYVFRDPTYRHERSMD